MTLIDFMIQHEIVVLIIMLYLIWEISEIIKAVINRKKPPAEIICPCHDEDPDDDQQNL